MSETKMTAEQNEALLMLASVLRIRCGYDRPTLYPSTRVDGKKPGIVSGVKYMRRAEKPKSP